MKKSALASVALACIALAACQKQKVTVSILDYQDATSPGYAANVALWDKFVKENPDIEIVKEELFNESFHEKTASYVAAGSMPDVFFMWPSGRSSLIHEKRLAKDLTKILAPEFLSKFAPVATDVANQGGKYLAMLPEAFTYTTAVYANKKLLADNGLSMPATYEDLKAMVPVLKAKGIQTVLMANKDDWVMQSCLFSTVAGRMVGDSFVNDVLAGKAKFTDKEFVDALAFIETLYKDGVLSRETVQLAYGEAPALFAAGKAAFLVDGDWRVGDFLTNKESGIALIAPAAQESDFEIVNFPKIPGERHPGVLSGVAGTGFGVSAAIPSGSAKEKAVKRVLEFRYGEEFQRQQLESGALVPSRLGIASDKIEPFTKKIIKYYADNAKLCPVLDGVLDTSVWTPCNLGLQQLGLGTTTPAKIAAEMQAAMDAFLKK